MVDNLTQSDRKKTMGSIKGTKNGPERKLHAMLAGMKLHGWEDNVKDIAGKPDIIFRQSKVAIFLDGCFWHGCPSCCKKIPATNTEYWKKKILHNIELGKIYDENLRNMGWIVIRIWEHELKDNKSMNAFKKNLSEILAKEENDNG